MKFLLVFLFSINAYASLPGVTYVKTDTPRDTMETFLNAMNDYRKGVESKDLILMARINDATRTFAEKPGQVITSTREKELAAIFLKEVIDRVIVIDLEKIPDNSERQRWRLKNTEIVLKPVKAGEREGEWLITEDTWKRAREMYQRVSHLPYLEGSGQGAHYDQPWMDELLPPWSRGETLKLRNWQWIGLFLGLVIGLFLKFLVQLFLRLFKKVSSRQSLQWKRDLIDSIENPVAMLIAALFWYGWFLTLQLEGIPYSITNGIIQITIGIACIWTVYKSIGIFGTYLKDITLKTESTLDDQLVPFFEKALKTFVVLIGVLLVLQNMGVNVFSILAGLGLGGLAFALAAQDSAANLIGSIIILTDRPFKIGDWVVVDGAEGTVEEVGFRSTRIRTFYNSLITVPNNKMANAKIDNMGERIFRRVRSILDITYDTPPEKIELFLEGIKNIILANQYTRKDYMQVAFTGYGPASLQIMVYFFLITPDWSTELEEKQNVYLEILRLAEKLEVEFAFPTQTLYVRQEEVPGDDRKPEDLVSISQGFGPEGSLKKPDGLGFYTPPHKQ